MGSDLQRTLVINGIGGRQSPGGLRKSYGRAGVIEEIRVTGCMRKLETRVSAI